MVSADKKRILFWSDILLWAVLAVSLVFLRASYGVEVTDEAYWVAEPYLVTQGAVPLADNWSQTPLTGLLLAPLVSVYTALTGGTEGIYLYMLRAAVVFRAAISMGVWLLLRRQMDDRIAAVCAILLFSCDMGHMRGLNYNVLSLYLLALAGALLYDAVSQENIQKSAHRCAAAGVVMALCALAHITQIVNCVLLAVILLFQERRIYKKVPLWMIYGLSGLLIAVVVTAGLELASGGNLFSGLGILLRENNYFRIPHMGFGQQAARSAEDLAFFGFKRWLPGFLLCFAIFSPLYFRKGGIHRDQFRAVFVLSLLGAFCIFLGWVCSRKGDIFPTDIPAMLLYIIVPLYLLCMETSYRRESFRMLLFLWLPCLVSWLMVALASHAPANYRYYALNSGAILTIPFIFSTLQGSFSLPERPKIAKWILEKSSLLPCLLGMLFSATMLLYLWNNVYRDDPIPQLTYRMEVGVYKGCYTSPERGHAMETLEQTIKELTSKSETVFFADLFPTGYLMTDSHYLAPTTWDPNMYRYGFQDSNLLFSYFELSGEIPDKIVYVNSEGEPLSIDDPENQFAAFVLDNYTLTAETGRELFSLRVFTKNPR